MATGSFRSLREVEMDGSIKYASSGMFFFEMLCDAKKAGVSGV